MVSHAKDPLFGVRKKTNNTEWEYAWFSSVRAGK